MNICVRVWAYMHCIQSPVWWQCSSSNRCNCVRTHTTWNYCLGGDDACNVCMSPPPHQFNPSLCWVSMESIESEQWFSSMSSKIDGIRTPVHPSHTILWSTIRNVTIVECLSPNATFWWQTTFRKLIIDLSGHDELKVLHTHIYIYIQQESGIVFTKQWNTIDAWNRKSYSLMNMRVQLA